VVWGSVPQASCSPVQQGSQQIWLWLGAGNTPGEYGHITQLVPVLLRAQGGWSEIERHCRVPTVPENRIMATFPPTVNHPISQIVVGVFFFVLFFLFLFFK
jgi:hypothetical protein